MRACLLFGQEGDAENGPSAWRLWLADAAGFCQSADGRLLVAVVLATLGLWLLLPGSSRGQRILGGLLAIIAAVCVMSLAPVIGGTVQVPFSVIAALTLVAAVCAITSQNPVYTAVWFAVALLGTGGLFLINGAQFLGIATVAVYAGAVVVTFLFVLMLAQPSGHAFYDRVGWGKLSQLLGCLAGVLLSAAVVWAVIEPGALADAATGQRALDHPQHVASLGGQLFTRHLPAVQAAGALLLAALVGAIAMASYGTGQRGLDTRMSTEGRAEHAEGGSPL